MRLTIVEIGSVTGLTRDYSGNYGWDQFVYDFKKYFLGADLLSPRVTLNPATSRDKPTRPLQGCCIMFAYRLAPRVRVCATDDGAVLLDVEDDKFLRLDPSQACALSLVVDSWPAGTFDERPHVDESCALELARVLCERGLLVPAAAPCQQDLALSTPRLPLLESELVPWCEMSPCHVSLRYVLRFLQSVLSAALMLKFMPFAEIVDRARRRRVSCASDGHAPFDAEAARRLVSAYSHLRPFLYGQKKRCLLDSLSLLEFLARERVYPTWVIGVRVHPFGSHSWLQHQTFILNGTPSYARAYTAILVL